MVQTSDGGYAIAGQTNSFGYYDFWLVKIAPSNGGPPGDCGWPVLVAPVQISSNAGYSVGDTLTANFTIQNQGTAAIHLDKLLFGGRFNGGTLPGGGFPDFSYSPVTLQVGQTYQYEGTLYLTKAGHYEFFVAYYIANPTEAERVRCALDPNNWNTCIDLTPGLTDNDRIWSVQVIANPGNLRAVSIEPVQVVWGVDLVQDKATDFRIGYESTFDVIVETDIRLETPGFDPDSCQFRYRFAPGSYSFVISSVQSSSPFFLARTKPEATFRFSIDPGNLIVETDETDNTFPRTDTERRNVIDTRSISILFVRVHHADEPEDDRITAIQAQTYMNDAMSFLTSTYPFASSEGTYELSPNPLVVERGRDWRWALDQLNRRIIAGRWPFRSYTYDRVVGVVNRTWAGWDTPDLFDHGSGFTTANSRAVMVKNLYDGSVAHEIGHTYGLGDDYAGGSQGAGTRICSTGSGYWVLRRQPVVNRPTFMHAGQPNRWVDNTDYNILSRTFETGDPEVILLSGVIFKNGTAELSESLYRVSDGAVDIEAGSIGNYYAALFDDLGNILSRVGFNVTFSVQSEPPREVEGEYFSFTIEWVNGTRMIQLQDFQGNVLATRTASMSSPLVTLISPNGNEVLFPRSNHTITWSAWDPDDDTLTYNVLISSGIDSIPVPITTVINQTSFSYDFADLAGGNQYLIYVVASDGVNVGGDVSDGFFTIASFATNVVTPPQFVSSGGKANYTLNITSYGGFSNPIVLNATSSTTDELVFRWINGSVILPVPNGSIEVILEIEVPYLTEGGNHTVILLGTSGNSTEVAIAYLFASSHDLAISGIRPSKNVVGQGFSMTFNVTVDNQGNFGETFTVSLYGGQTVILQGSTYLSPQNSTTVTLTWNTSGFAKDNYTVWAYAEPVSDETDMADNNFTGGWVIVSIKGDLTGGTPNALDFVPDGKVQIVDISVVAKFFGQKVPPAPSNCDVSGPTIGVPDGKIDITDVATVAKHFGEHYP